MKYEQENTPKASCFNNSSRIVNLLGKLEIPKYIVVESVTLHHRMVDMGYPNNFLVFLACFSIKQKVHMDNVILLKDIALSFDVCLDSLREAERRILIKIKYCCH
eukprot:NODE_118_length_18907_cov_0.436251.p11 type:complete len:105 gc:universal NODE_118_length_18907_cov_0.436251:14353-14039(-)